ncbi:hypothetical protein F4779DRAFT_572104 [Xylariaceae sp. FL0662B]|nr:hypothetical protein F4779DRAFT_572104 [Xylariaceae sp. FL0662B]
MRLTTFFSGLVALALASLADASDRTAAIYIQPVSQSPAAPAPLAEIHYDPAAASDAQIASYEAPEIPDEAKLVRVGIYNPSTKQWESSTSVASVENFSKGYSPTVMLSVDQKGDVIGAALRGVRIDAGQTRDFGPQALVLVTEPGRQPDLNKPIVLSPEGKKVEEEEKTFFQKYYCLTPLPTCCQIMTSADFSDRQVLVVDRHRCLAVDDWRRRRGQMIRLYDYVLVQSMNFVLLLFLSLFYSRSLILRVPASLDSRLKPLCKIILLFCIQS